MDSPLYWWDHVEEKYDVDLEGSLSVVLFWMNRGGVEGGG